MYTVCKLLCSEIVHLLKFTTRTLQVSQNVNCYVDFRVQSSLHCCKLGFSALCEYIPLNRLSCEKVQANFTLLYNLVPYSYDHCSISMHKRTDLVESQEAHQF